MYATSTYTLIHTPTLKKSFNICQFFLSRVLLPLLSSLRELNDKTAQRMRCYKYRAPQMEHLLVGQGAVEEPAYREGRQTSIKILVLQFMIVQSSCDHRKVILSFEQQKIYKMQKTVSSHQHFKLLNNPKFKLKILSGEK